MCLSCKLLLQILGYPLTVVAGEYSPSGHRQCPKPTGGGDCYGGMLHHVRRAHRHGTHRRRSPTSRRLVHKQPPWNIAHETLAILSLNALLRDVARCIFKCRDLNFTQLSFSKQTLTIYYAYTHS